MIGSLKCFLTGFAPAAIRWAKPLIEHVNVKPVNAIGQLLGHQLLHRFQIARVQAEASDPTTGRINHLVLGMILQKMSGLLHDAVGDDGKSGFFRFVHGFSQNITLAESGAFTSNLRIVISPVPIACPDHKVLRTCRDTLADNIAATEVTRVGDICRFAIAKLRSGRSDLHTDQGCCVPRLLARLRDSRLACRNSIRASGRLIAGDCCRQGEAEANEDEHVESLHAQIPLSSHGISSRDTRPRQPQYT